jgi:iron complex transport system substrate-binding protein
LEDVFECAFLIAKALGSEKSAVTYISNLQSRLNKVTDTLRAHQAPLKRVMLMEWIEPIYNCGHWIPYQIAYAGGVDMLSNPSGDSIVTPWDKIVQYNPQVIVIAPCGFFPERTIEEIDILTTKPAWSSLLAVQTNNVYIANFDLFTQPSASTLTDGIQLLAGLFHPEIFKIPEQLVEKYYPLNLLMVH